MIDYRLLKEQMDALTGTQSRPVPNLANASALLWQILPDLNWAGFYLMEDGALYLGPFQGKTACIRIPLGQGVCGTAAQKVRCSECTTYMNLKGISPVTAHRIPRLSFRSTTETTSLRYWILTVRLGQVEADEEGLKEIVKVLEKNCIWK